MAKTEELIVIDRTYELVRWYLAHLAKFPRAYRYGLGARLEQRLYDVLEGLIQAKYSAASERADLLLSANLDLQIIRLLTRLADESRLLPHRSYEHAARELTEIGSMVGGWLRQQRQKAASSSS